MTTPTDKMGMGMGMGMRRMTATDLAKLDTRSPSFCGVVAQVWQEDSPEAQ